MMPLRAPTFKAQYRQAPRGAATPPRPVYEPISPVLRPSDPPAVTPAGAKDNTAAQSTNDALIETLHAAAARVQYSPAPRRFSLASAKNDPRPPTTNLQPSPALPSPVEAPANAPSSVGPAPAHIELSHRSQHAPPSPPPADTPRAPKHAYPADSSAYREPPSKRARSEVLPSPQQPPQHPHHYSRPSTSYNPGWSYHVERTADRGTPRYQQPADVPKYQLDERAVADAQLLLDFAIAVSSPQPVQRYIPAPKSWSFSQQDAVAHYGGRPSAEHNTAHHGSPYYPARPVDYPSLPLPPPPPPPRFEPSAPANKMAPDASPGVHSASLAVQTHTPTDEHSSAGALNKADTVDFAEEKKLKKHHGWPKGKPRGPRNGASTEKKKRAAPNPTSVTVPSVVSEQIHPPQSLPTEAKDNVALLRHEAIPVPPQAVPEGQTLQPFVSRSRGLSESHTRSLGTLGGVVSPTSLRAKSVPASATMPSASPAPADPNEPAPDADSSQTTICAGCNSSESVTSIGDGEQWISCDGCKGWFHYACAGFKSEREVRTIDKFYCDGCRPKFGNTTKLRKSSRVHTAVDYAGLNEGIMKTSDDNPEHHYIQSFKNGDIGFTPEAFARLPAECVTADFVEKMNGFNEPVVIPASLNPRPERPRVALPTQPPAPVQVEDASEEQCPYELVPDDGQDKIDMIIPEGLTVRRVSELYGPNEKVPVIDVKTQDGMDQWTMGKWADYYEQEGEKPVRNVISLEVSRSKLGRLIRRPKIVRDMDLQDSVWRDDDKYLPPAVQFYCLMSVADCYTDFHIDFGGSSVFYHIIKGRKTFFFIPPTKQNLKKYEDWCLSPKQSQEFLGHQVKECYRIDLYPGDTMLIPSGWIHAVWTPEDSLVIGGNYLTRIHYAMQIRVCEIEKNTKVSPKFRYPYFQKIMWLAVIKYLEDDPLPATVEELLLNGGQFERKIPIYCEPDKFGHNSDLGPENYHQRYYPKGEVEGLSDLVTYIWRTVMISLGKIEGITQQTRNAVTRSIPKGFGEPSILARRFAMWVAWKKGNERIPAWALPDGPLPIPTGDKSLSSAQAKKMERESWNETLKLVRGGERHSSLRARASEQPVNGEPRMQSGAPVTGFLRPHREHVTTPKTSQLGPKRIACDACRKRRIRCKHKDELVESPQSSASGSGNANIPASSSPPTKALGDIGARRVSEGDVLTGSLPFVTPFEPPAVVNGGPISADLSADVLANKSGRVKACADCRKSKRRCIHDENGNVDPVKAAEAPVPRGSASKKRRSGDDDDGEALTKKMKMESFAGLLDGEVSHWNRYPLQKPRPRSATTSRSIDGSTEQCPMAHHAIDPQLMDGDGDVKMGESSHPLPHETIVSSIEHHHAEPTDGIEIGSVNTQAPSERRNPAPRTPAPAHGTAEDRGLNGVAVVSPSPVSPTTTTCRPRPVMTSPNWNKSSRASVRSWNGMVKTPPSAKSGRDGKDGSKISHPRSEQKPKPRAMSSTSARPAAGKSGEEMASIALALQLQMEEHGLRRRSK